MFGPIEEISIEDLSPFLSNLPLHFIIILTDIIAFQT
jgi:hypothetical protein